MRTVWNKPSRSENRACSFVLDPLTRSSPRDLTTCQYSSQVIVGQAAFDNASRVCYHAVVLGEGMAVFGRWRCWCPRSDSNRQIPDRMAIPKIAVFAISPRGHERVERACPPDGKELEPPTHPTRPSG